MRNLKTGDRPECVNKTADPTENRKTCLGDNGNTAGAELQQAFLEKAERLWPGEPQMHEMFVTFTLDWLGLDGVVAFSQAPDGLLRSLPWVVWGHLSAKCKPEAGMEEWIGFSPAIGIGELRWTPGENLDGTAALCCQGRIAVLEGGQQ